MSQTVFLIIGASGGLGRPLAFEALRRGHKVIAASRKSKDLASLEEAGASLMDLDVTADDDTMRAKLQEAHAMHQRLTHVINCAGYLLSGAVEEASSEEVASLFATNVLGVANVSRASIPYLREAAASRAEGDESPVALAHFGSSVGWAPSPVSGHYCASKIAVTVLTESMAKELAPQGISACSIDAGAFRTAFLSPRGSEGSGAERHDDGDDPGLHIRYAARKMPDVYAREGTPARMLSDAMAAADGLQPGDPLKAASVLVDVLTGTGMAAGRRIPERLVLGSDSVAYIRGRMKGIEENLAVWEAVSASTDL